MEVTGVRNRLAAPVRALRSMTDEVLVCSRSDLSRLPLANLPTGFTFRVINMHDPDEIDAWLAVHNDAFGRGWGPENYQKAILENPILRVIETFFLEHDGGTVAAASVAVFRRNENVGAGHYLGVIRRAQGLGLGKELVIHRYHVLRDLGFTACESQTHVGRTRSLLIHFDCGFTPKYRLDHWNSPDTARPPVRALANVRLYRLYSRWLRSKTASSRPARRVR